MKHNTKGISATGKPAAFLSCVKCILYNKTHYIRHLRVWTLHLI